MFLILSVEECLIALDIWIYYVKCDHQGEKEIASSQSLISLTINQLLSFLCPNYLLMSNKLFITIWLHMWTFSEEKSVLENWYDNNILFVILKVSYIYEIYINLLIPHLGYHLSLIILCQEYECNCFWTQTSPNSYCQM